MIQNECCCHDKKEQEEKHVVEDICYGHDNEHVFNERQRWSLW